MLNLDPVSEQPANASESPHELGALLRFVRHDLQRSTKGLKFDQLDFRSTKIENSSYFSFF